jgi:iron complex outermembrane receptor protein
MKFTHINNNISIALSALLLTSSVLFAEEKNTENLELNSVDIIAQTTSGYQHDNKMKTSRTNIPLKNTAKSIQVFNEKIIQDAQIQNIQDVITLSSNTVYTGHTDGKSTNISIRGFSSVPILTDGLRTTYTVSDPEIFNYQAIEVQKGPDSLQYGKSSPGGIVNLVRKKPSREDIATIALEISDKSSFNPKIDLGGSLNNEETLYYRLISVFEYDEGFTNSNTNTKKIFIAPSISYDINDNHTLTFFSEYTDETTPTNFGSNVNSHGDIVASRETITSHPDEKFKKTQKIFGVELNSDFDTFNSNFKYQYNNYTRDYGDVYLPLSFDKTTNSVTRYPATQLSSSEEHSFQYTLNKELDLLGYKNNLTFGVDYNRVYVGGDSVIDFAGASILNLSNPVYEDGFTLPADYIMMIDMSSKRTYLESSGMFIQDNIHLNEKLILNAGLRYSQSKPEKSEKANALTPSLGLVYHISPKTTLYTSYSESFTPNTNKDSSGQVIDPETGKGFDIGIKQKLFNNNFDLTTSLFKIKKTNIAQKDPSDLTNTYYVASGEQTSEGFEIDLKGNITPEFSLVASYGYTDTKDKNNKDNALRNIPKHTANIFSTYNLAKLDLPNMHIGGGAKYIGSRYGDTDNTIEFDSEIIYNATIGYQKNNWKFNLSIQNITDVVYVNGSASGKTSDTRVYLGDPRTAIATLSYTF